MEQNKQQATLYSRRSKSIRRLYFFTVILTLAAMLVLAIYSFRSFYSNAVNEALALGESTLKQEVEQLNAYLDKGIDVLQVTAINIESMMRRKQSNEEILHTLTNESKYYMENIDSNFTGVYGWINGEYLDGIGWVPDDDYVPKERVWYTDAVEAGGESVIVSPYLDAQTNTIMISVSQMLYDKDSVVSYDIALNRIQEITQGISLNHQGYGFVCDKEGLVVAHSNEEEKGANYKENKTMSRLLDKVYAKGETNFNMELNGKSCTVFSNVIRDDWYVVMVVDNTELFRNVKDVLIRNIALCIIIFLLVMIFCTIALHRASLYMNQLDDSRKKLDSLNETILGILAKTIDAKDKYTKGHSVRVAEYSRELAKRMGKSEEEQKEIYNVALLHDIGKIRIPNSLINKPGKLTKEEYDLIKLHPVAGYHILKDISENQVLSIGAKFHHERYDGTGYPNGLSGDNIPEYARIIGVADSYDAMASNRSYRNALPQDVVRSEIEKGRGTQFDPRIADIMLQLIDEDKDYQMRESGEEKKTILVADGDRKNLKMVKSIFKDEAMYQLISVTGGKKALEVLNKTKVDMVFLATQMPDMDGHEILEQIKAQYTVPVVFMTANEDSSIQKALELEVEDFLTKPFLPSVLMEVVHSVLNK